MIAAQVVQLLNRPPFSKDLSLVAFDELTSYDLLSLINDIFSHLDKKDTASPVYSFTVHVDCDNLNKDLDDIYNSLSPADKPINIITKPIRKAPKKPASMYEDGLVMTGLDERLWKVKTYPNGTKRWVLNK